MDSGDDTTSQGEMFGMPPTTHSELSTGIRRCIEATRRPGNVHEHRAVSPKHHGGTISGYYVDREAAIRAALAHTNLRAPSVEAYYQTINPVTPEALARAVNRDQKYASSTTTDADIARRTHLPLDVDPVRIRGISATDDEWQAALAFTVSTLADLNELFGIRPVLAGTSGNGGFAWFRVDLPNDDESTQLVKAVLNSLAVLFTAPGVKIDTSVYNASRIMKIPGTVAAKGDHMIGQDQPDRPWRYSWASIIDANAPIATVDQLRDVVEAGR